MKCDSGMNVTTAPVIIDAWGVKTAKLSLKKAKNYHNNDTSVKDASIRKVIGELATQSNVHGISFLVGNKAIPVRLFWGFAFLGLFSFAVYQLYTIGTIYYSYPVKTKIKMEFKPLPFPAITICNMNTIRHSKIKEIESKVLQEMLNGTYDMNAGSGYQTLSTTPYFLPPFLDPLQSTTAWYTAFPLGTEASSTTIPKTSASSSASQSTTGAQSVSSSNAASGTGSSTTSGYDSGYWDYWDYGSSGTYEDTWDYFNADYYTSPLQSSYVRYEKFLEEYLKIDRDEKKKVGHKLKNMLLECQFNGRKCNVPIKDVVTYEYGNCFTIQSSKFVAGSTGPRSGMVLTINLENHEAIEDLTEGYGMRMVIHEPKTFPLPLEEGITISGGYETSIGLKMTRIERKGKPYGECIDPRHYFKTHAIRYSTQTCIQQCWEQQAYSKCGCQVGNVHSEMRRFHDQSNVIKDKENTKGCYENQDRKCSLDVRRSLLIDIDKYCNCPQPCLENAYTKTFSGRIWPHQTKLVELLDDACLTYEGYNITGYCGLSYWNDASLNTNFLKVNIYFEDLNYEVISEEPLYDATQLISDVGGSLGLCLGASLLCICEIFEALTMIFVVLVRKICGHTAVSEISFDRSTQHELR